MTANAITTVTSQVEASKVPVGIEKILKAMPMRDAVEFDEWMAKGVLGASQIPRHLMDSYLQAKAKVDGLSKMLLKH